MATRYATLEQFYKFGAPRPAVEGIPTEDIGDQLDVASSVADSKIGLVVDLPITEWSLALTIAVCRIAAYQVMFVRGFNPEGPDSLFKDNLKYAMEWLDCAKRSDVLPPTSPEDPPAPPKASVTQYTDSTYGRVADRRDPSAF